MLILVLITLFLVANVLAHFCLIKAYGANTIASRPEMIPCEVFPSPKVTLVEQNSRFSLQSPNRLRYCIARRDTQAHVHMIDHSMTFYQFYAKLATQFTEYATYLLTQASKYRFFAIFGDEHNVIQAIPSRMGPVCSIRA